MPANTKKIKPLLSQLIKAGVTSFSGPREGDVVEVELIKKTTREAYFDVAGFGTGIIYGQEFVNAKNIIRNLKVGDQLPAKIASLTTKAVISNSPSRKPKNSKSGSKSKNFRKAEKL